VKCSVKCLERKYIATLGNHVGNRPAGKDKALLSSLASELTRDTVQLTVNKATSHSTTSSPATTMFDSTPKVPAITYNLGNILSFIQMPFIIIIIIIIITVVVYSAPFKIAYSVK